MIRSITVINEHNESLVLDLASPDISGLAVYSIDGIGPGKANINLNENASLHGDRFSSARIPNRAITINLRYMWTETIEEARLRSYKFFSPTKKVSLIFETDLRSCVINGYVESNEPTIFSSSSGCSISIICPDPFFRALNDQRTSFYSIMPLFEFPYSNESLVNPLTEFSEIIDRDIFLINYSGDADTGMIINIEFTNPPGEHVKMPAIWNTRDREYIGIDTDKLEMFANTEFLLHDQLVISTERGNKYAYLIREGNTINLLGCLLSGYKWLQIHAGDQIIKYTADEGGRYMKIDIDNKILYEGV